MTSTPPNPIGSPPSTPPLRRLGADSFRAETMAPGSHILTYAEIGFSPLTLHTQHLGLEAQILEAFAAQVNALDEPGTLHPVAPLSAVPRRLIRDNTDSTPLTRSIVEFLLESQRLIEGATLVVDFRTPRVSMFAITALEAALLDDSATCLREVVLIN